MNTSHATHRITALAARQHGNVSLAQLRAAGLTPGEIRGRVHRGWLVRRHAGVYALGHVPSTRPSRWSAAVLALGDDAALSHGAAGAHWAIVSGSVSTEVTVPTRAGRRRRDGVIVHRAPLPSGHVVVRDGIRTTSLVRTILDLATQQDARELARSFEEAQVQHDLRPEVLAAELVARPGYRGTARVAQVLDGAVDPARVRSVLEIRFLRLCAAHDIPRPLVNERIGPWRPDFRWPAARLVVETDSRRFHRTAAKRRRDARKDAFFAEHGYAVVRLRWAEVTDAPALVASEIRRALAAGGVRGT